MGVTKKFKSHKMHMLLKVTFMAHLGCVVMARCGLGTLTLYFRDQLDKVSLSSGEEEKKLLSAGIDNMSKIFLVKSCLKHLRTPNAEFHRYAPGGVKLCSYHNRMFKNEFFLARTGIPNINGLCESTPRLIAPTYKYAEDWMNVHSYVESVLAITNWDKTYGKSLEALFNAIEVKFQKDLYYELVLEDDDNKQENILKRELASKGLSLPRKDILGNKKPKTEVERVLEEKTELQDHIKMLQEIDQRRTRKYNELESKVKQLKADAKFRVARKSDASAKNQKRVKQLERENVRLQAELAQKNVDLLTPLQAESPSSQPGFTWPAVVSLAGLAALLTWVLPNVLRRLRRLAGY